MTAFFPNFAFMNDENAVRMFDRRQPVRDDQCRAVFEQLIQRFLNQRFGVRVDRTGGFVEDENFRVEGQRASKR